MKDNSLSSQIRPTFDFLRSKSRFQPSTTYFLLCTLSCPRFYIPLPEWGLNLFSETSAPLGIAILASMQSDMNCARGIVGGPGGLSAGAPEGPLGVQ
jgi:hypothetical protein